MVFYTIAINLYLFLIDVYCFLFDFGLVLLKYMFLYVENQSGWLRIINILEHKSFWSARNLEILEHQSFWLTSEPGNTGKPVSVSVWYIVLFFWKSYILGFVGHAQFQEMTLLLIFIHIWWEKAIFKAGTGRPGHLSWSWVKSIFFNINTDFWP